MLMIIVQIWPTMWLVGGLEHLFLFFYINIFIYTVTDRIMEKNKTFHLQAPPVYDRKVTNLFFSIIIVSIIIFFP